MYTIKSTDPPRFTAAELAGEDGDEDGVIPLETIIAAKELNTAIPAEFQSCIELYWKSRSEVLPPPGAPQAESHPPGQRVLSAPLLAPCVGPGAINVANHSFMRSTPAAATSLISSLQQNKHTFYILTRESAPAQHLKP